MCWCTGRLAILSAIVTASLAQTSCPPGWKSSGTPPNCYYAITEFIDSYVDVSWNDAELKCKSLGATYGYTASLTSIHSEDENYAIWLWLLGYEPLLIRKHVWIGLIKNETNGQFTWSDGTDFDFTKWMYGEPRNYTVTPECGAMALEHHNGDTFVYGYWYNGFSCDYLMQSYAVCKTQPQ